MAAGPTARISQGWKGLARGDKAAGQAAVGETVIQAMTIRPIDIAIATTRPRAAGTNRPSRNRPTMAPPSTPTQVHQMSSAESVNRTSTNAMIVPMRPQAAVAVHNTRISAWSPASGAWRRL